MTGPSTEDEAEERATLGSQAMAGCALTSVAIVLLLAMALAWIAWGTSAQG